MAQEKFLVDAMLIKLGRWLRILGYDCKIPDYNNKYEIMDVHLAESALKEGRILLTMDRELSKMAQFSGTKVILIPSNLSHIKKQLKFLFKKSLIDSSILKNIESLDKSTRCVFCGGKLKLFQKQDFGKVENMKDWVRARHSQVWSCTSCKQIYWKGSHWKKIIEMLQEIKNEY